MEKYNILFRGYRRDCNRAGLPTYSGIYIVYRCTFNQEKQTVSLKELLYIGQAQNIRDRISGHDKREEFFNAAKEGEQICHAVRRRFPNLSHRKNRSYLYNIRVKA